MSAEEYPREVEQRVEDSQENEQQEEVATAAAEENQRAHADRGETDLADDEQGAALEAEAEGNVDDEPPGANEEEVMDEANIADKRVFLGEVQRIDESTMSIIRSLAAMTNVEDEDLRANIVEVFEDIRAEEMNLFSPVPDYIATIIDKEKEVRARKSKSVQPHDEIPRASTIQRSHYNAEHRAFVDPSVPLALPYNLDRERREHPNRNGATGTYHDLFYGDGSQCVFSPPEDNKRQQLEAERAAHQLAHRPPVSYEPVPRRPMRVSSDFVPSCANGTSASQRDSANPVYRRSSGFALRTSKPVPKKAGRTQVAPFP